ncbi:endonuclease/exonuclease/phosphatase family protein [Streptomyces sp. NBC_01794]|uniref:endonuclease/exonuclease/phosphatase family protein n=1 Tax=Streptomyces sp. NBC_01794 TaxID=2975942 RepID=UPI0030866F74|nr:endonuclease/exonuclease/phosphatase family protein [Streptomyces sp. NBC_01794]WSB05162.1 endonuclease/exonuclease/phosphatase family protein [Streptomyces sp. NBC_01794]
MRRSLMALGAALALGLAVPLVGTSAKAEVEPEADGTLTVSSSQVEVGEPIALTYFTYHPDPDNWIGLSVDSGDGSADPENGGPDVKRALAPSGKVGTVTLSTQGLAPGTYSASFRAKENNTLLAEPVRFRVTADEPLRFLTSRIPLRNAHALAPYQATVSGLVRHAGDDLTFRKVSGPRWVRVGKDGSIFGTPHQDDASPSPQKVSIEARNADGESSTATAEVDVRTPGAQLVPDFRMMTWNMAYGGSEVNGARDKQLALLLDHDVDVVGIQEGDADTAKELAEALGWYYRQTEDVDGDEDSVLGVLSRYPIVSQRPVEVPSEVGALAMSTRIRLDERRKQDIVVWSTHLFYEPYGPYDACFGHLSEKELIAREAASGRTKEIKTVLEAMERDIHLAARTPVLLTGDFNAASHLDWTAKAKRCGYTSVAWPTSVLPAKAGLKDSFRIANPDPVTEPGTTWSPIYPTFTGGYGYDDHAGEPEPQDRIDFVYFRGGLSVLTSDVLVSGNPEPAPNHRDNLYPSDHAAVLSLFHVR